MATMPIPIDQRDFAVGIDLASPSAVADEVCRILAQRYDAFAPDAVRQGFIDVEDAYAGRYPGLLACDTPYHDLYHALSTTLLMARMMDGYEASHGADLPALGCDKACVAVVLALFHDIGFLRRESEAHMIGAHLVHDHEQRSVDFVQAYLANGVFADHAQRAGLIHATNFNLPIQECLKGQPAEFWLLGQMLGTADLVSQVGERYYLERCRDFLFEEMTAAGADRHTSSDGTVTVHYTSPEDLLRKTPDFFEHVVKRRLEVDLAQVDRFIAPHFGGDDPYARYIERNMTHLRDMIRRSDFSGMQRKPPSLLRPVK